MFGEDSENQNIKRKTYEILRITPKKNYTRNYMDWVVSGVSQNSLPHIEIYLITAIIWICFSFRKIN